MAGVPMTAAIQGLSCELVHGPSGSTLTTVPPKDKVLAQFADRKRQVLPGARQICESHRNKLGALV